jgi:hypothetical protein
MNGLPEPVRIMVAIALLVVLASLAGCAGAPQIVETKVAIPVECRAAVPARPAMPTEALAAATTTLDQFVAASQAEIELREGYEIELLAALQQCTAPLPARGP